VVKEKIIQQNSGNSRITGVIQQGAEAVLIRNGDELIKRRDVKGYRLKELDDKLRKRRTKSEGKLLGKAGKLICVPTVDNVDNRKMEIEMEFISGLKLSESLDEMKNWRVVCFMIGENIAKLHDAGIIHGDLTTSNMIWVARKLDSTSLNGKTRSARSISKKTGACCEDNSLDNNGAGSSDNNGVGVKNVIGKAKSGELYFIDFGLGFANGRVEDKAVDLYLIKEALEAKHFKRFEEYFNSVVEGYKKTSERWKETLERLKKVENY